MKTICTICLILCVLSCKQNNSISGVEVRKENGNSFLWVDLDQAGDTIDFDIAELIDSVRLVKLETSEEALINRTSGILASDDILFVYHQEQNLMRFDFSGRFLGNIGRLGQGPFEYRYINRMAFDPSLNKILLQPSGKMQYYLFDTEGNSLQTLPRSLDGNTVLGFVDGEILEWGYRDWSRGPILPEYISFINQNIQGEIQYKDTSFFNMLEVRVGGVTLPLIGYPFQNEYKVFFSRDTLYVLDTKTGTLTPNAVFTATKNGFNYSAVEKDIRTGANTLANKINRVYTEVHAETDKYFLLRKMIYTDSDQGYQMATAVSYYCVNKKKKTVHPVRLKDSFWGLMLDRHASPMPFPHWKVVDNKYVIMNYQAIDLLEEIDLILDKNEVSQEIREKLSNLQKELDEEDNLVLFVYYLIGSPRKD